MLSVGLTGGPGCGKSLAARFFADFGSCRVFDADAVGHEIFAEKDGPVARAVAGRWGARVVSHDGAIDRKAVAELVFGNENERLWLNSVTHPEILRRIERRAADAGDCGFVIVEAALLFETGWNTRFDVSIDVWAPRKIQIGRLLERGWSPEHAEKRIDSQWPSDKKLEAADFGIINASSLDSLREQCKIIDGMLASTNRSLH